MVPENELVNTVTKEKSAFGNRLRQERVRLKLRLIPFAHAGGVQKGSQIKYEKGDRSPDVEYLLRVAEIGVDIPFVLTGVRSDMTSGVADIDQESYVVRAGRRPDRGCTIASGVTLIPRFEAGEPKGGDTSDNEVIVETLAVTDDFMRANRLTADRVVSIKVCESSMSPTLEHGDQVIVDRGVSRVVGDGVYAVRHAGVLKIKRPQMRGDGSLLMLSDNPSYQPEVIAASQIAASLVVIGRVLPYKFGRIRL